MDWTGRIISKGDLSSKDRTDVIALAWYGSYLSRLNRFANAFVLLDSAGVSRKWLWAWLWMTNAFFVRKDLSKDLFTEDDSSEYLCNPPRYYLIFDHFHHIGHRADFGPYEDLK